MKNRIERVIPFELPKSSNDEFSLSIQNKTLVIKINYKQLKPFQSKLNYTYKYKNVIVKECYLTERIIEIKVSDKQSINDILCSINCCFTLIKMKKCSSECVKINNLYNAIKNKSKEIEEFLINNEWTQN